MEGKQTEHVCLQVAASGRSCALGPRGEQHHLHVEAASSVEAAGYPQEFVQCLCSTAQLQRSTAQHSTMQRIAAQHSAPSRSCRPPCSLGPAACPEMEVEEGPTCQGRPLNRAAASDAGPSGMPCGRCVPAAGVSQPPCVLWANSAAAEQQQSSRGKETSHLPPTCASLWLQTWQLQNVPPARLLTQAAPKSAPAHPPAPRSGPRCAGCSAPAPPRPCARACSGPEGRQEVTAGFDLASA